MTKRERLKRARTVRRLCGIFVDAQGTYGAFLLSQGRDPDPMALKALVAAKRELDDLIGELVAVGYGRDETCPQIASR